MIGRFCREYGFAPDMTLALEEAYCCLQKNREAYAVFDAQVACCRENLAFDHIPVFQQLHALQESTGVPAYTVDLLYLICLTPILKKRYEEEQIDLRYYDGFACNLRQAAEECRNIYGVAGVGVAWWLIDFFKLKLFSIGRLQFKWRRFKKNVAVGQYVFHEGDAYVDVHIPGGESLTQEKCRAAYAQAAAFFRRRFGMQEIIFGCYSWLLAPEIRGLLPETSNIRAFAGDYTVLETTHDPESWAVRYIFDVPALPENLDLLSEDTALRKAVKECLRAGNTINPAFGVMRPFSKK